MAIIPFLAMTAAEMGKFSDLPQKIAWMACHFSPYGLGLSNLPRKLPHQSILILDDITPIRGHDPIIISSQLLECVRSHDCSGILLDFQRPDDLEAAELASHLTEVLPCPVIVSEAYAANLSCPVFLPPASPSASLDAYIAPWKGRKIWLEIGLTGEVLALTEQGCRITPLPYSDTVTGGFKEKALRCHYTIETDKKSARFTLWRTLEDLKELLEEADDLGVCGAVGLYQELRQFL